MKESRTRRVRLSMLVSTRTTDCQVPRAGSTVDDRDGDAGRDERRQHVVPTVTRAAVIVTPGTLGRRQ